MSVIRVDNFGPSAGGTTYSARGIAKAWVNFDGNNTVTIRDSENVSSLTDNGTGVYTVAYSNVFTNGNYIASVGNYNQQSNDRFGTTLGYSNIYQASQIRMAHFELATETDTGYMLLVAHGDLA